MKGGVSPRGAPDGRRMKTGAAGGSGSMEFLKRNSFHQGERQ